MIAWEKQHRPLGPGDVVLFYSGYSDAFYKPLPEGRRFAALPLEGKSPAWPGPDPDCMAYLAGRKVMTAGIDSTSMGPIPDLAEPTHYAGLKHGMIWTESNIGFGALPANRSVLLHPRPQDMPAESTANAGPLPSWATRSLAADRLGPPEKRGGSVRRPCRGPACSWPGRGVGNHRQPFMKPSFGLNPNTRTPFEMHMLDTHTGTHLVPPAYALPREGFDDRTYSPEVQEWLAEYSRNTAGGYERHHGREGPARPDLRSGPRDRRQASCRLDDPRTWPASPEITITDIEKHEKAHGELKAGDVVIFHSGWSDRYCRPLPAGKACMEAPLNGNREGWPAPGPEAIFYLAKKGHSLRGHRCTDPGRCRARAALMTYWAMGGQEMAGVEYLTHLGHMPRMRFSCSPR